jgi:hypothetical protein
LALIVSALSFAINWDYRCPYARNANEHVVEALRAGAPWDVQFVSFSLDQTHVIDGGAAVWDEPERYPGLLANEVGIVLRDRFPDQFLSAHVALFAARHDRSLDTRDRGVLADVLTGLGIDAGAVMAEVDDGWPLETFRKEHENAVSTHQIFGVPTFVIGEQAAFVRVLTRPAGDAALAASTIERIVDLTAGWSDLNELKHTSIPR